MNEIDENKIEIIENSAITKSDIESNNVCDYVNQHKNVVNDNNENFKLQEEQQDELLYQLPYSKSSTSCDNKLYSLALEINKIYGDRNSDIDKNASGDYKLKCTNYKEWVDQLISIINHMLEALSELELTATQYISELQNKLNDCKIYDHVGDFNNENLRNDLINLLKLIRRAIEENNWNIKDLNFKTITEEQIFDGISKNQFLKNEKLNFHSIGNECQTDKLLSQNNFLRTELDKKDLQITTLEIKIKQLENEENKLKCQTLSSVDNKDDNNSNDNLSDCIDERKSFLSENEKMLEIQLEKNAILKSELEALKSKCDRKEKVIDSMKSLAFEVADKHDQIQQQRSQLFAMEEELQQSLKNIQYKDSVIRDLRRDLKNHLIKQSPCHNHNMNLTSRTFCTALSAESNETIDDINCQQDEHQQQPEVQSIIEFDENMKQDDMNRMIEFEESKLSAYQAEEKFNFKTLELELDKLSKLKECGNEDIYLSQDFEHLIQRFRSTMRSAVNVNNLTTSKLQNIRKQLIKIVRGNNDIKNDEFNNNDCGYMSQDDTEFDNNLLISVSGKISNLQNELNCSKNQIEELQMEIESAHSNVSSTTQILEKSSRVLRDLLQYLVKISGSEINLETVFHNTSDENGITDINEYRNLFCDALENIVIERNSKIIKLKEYVEDIENSLKERESLQLDVQNELRHKDKMIETLQTNLNFSNENIKIMEDEKLILNQEIEKFSNLPMDLDLKKLLNEKEELQTLNKNQVTTISNLMAALESIKIGQHESSSGGNRVGNNDLPHTSNEFIQSNEPLSNIIIENNNQSRSGSLWSWLRGNTYDV